MTGEDGRVDWTLTAAPDLGRTAKRAVAACPHGTTVPTLFGRDELAISELPTLTWLHTQETGCDCTPGTLTIDGEEVGR